MKTPADRVGSDRFLLETDGFQAASSTASSARRLGSEREGLRPKCGQINVLAGKFPSLVLQAVSTFQRNMLTQFFSRAWDGQFFFGKNSPPIGLFTGKRLPTRMHLRRIDRVCIRGAIDCRGARRERALAQYPSHHHHEPTQPTHHLPPRRHVPLPSISVLQPVLRAWTAKKD